MLVRAGSDRFSMRASILLIFFAAGVAYAQLNVMPPQPVYDGQKVDAIDLIGNPHRDLEPLRGVVVQQAGEPYSQRR